jgi:hypothetical protein
MVETAAPVRFVRPLATTTAAMTLGRPGSI